MKKCIGIATRAGGHDGARCARAIVRTCAGLVLAMAACGVVFAGDDKDVFKRVEAGRADVGPSATSMRVMPRSSQTPSNFEYVYRIERGKYAGRFARRDGAVTAVFPRSVYSDIDGVIVPGVPPGTTYVIGGIGANEAGSGSIRGANEGAPRPSMNVPRGASMPAGNSMVDTRAPSSGGKRRASESGAADAAQTPVTTAGMTPKGFGVQTIWTDDGLRKSRVLALLESVRVARPARR
jgi:hypothetical protein